MVVPYLRTLTGRESASSMFRLGAQPKTKHICPTAGLEIIALVMSDVCNMSTSCCPLQGT